MRILGLKIILSHILGYVRIRVESVFIERFINICISKKILIWNIKREKSTILYANISIGDFKKIKQIARKTKSNIQIQEKNGIPFIIHKYRKRKIILLLFSIIFIGLVVMSNFIWNIEVVGNTNIPKDEIIENLNKEGLKIGSLKKSINTDKVINKVRLLRDDISWMGIDIKGTNVIVEIKERDKAPEIINKEDYCNIISDKTGIITKINVQEGVAAVKVGDLIKKGDVLVQGYLEGIYTGVRYVHSIADIEVKTWYSKKEKFYFETEIPVATGETEKKYSLYINNFKINFYKTLSKFQNYDTINERKKILLFPNFYIPIQIEKKTNKEYKIINNTYTEDELLEVATDKLSREIIEEIQEETNIINKQINTYKADKYIEVEMIYEVIEKAGVQEKIF